MKIKLLSSFAAVALLLGVNHATAQPNAQLVVHQTNCPACDDLGWELTMHAYTFKEYPISEAINKTAALGLKYMSLSGSVNLGNKKSAKTVDLTDEQLNAILKQTSDLGIKLVNIGVVQLPPNEAESRKVFEFAKKAGIDTLVAEPVPEALDTIEKLCKEYNIKVAIHEHARPNHYWNPDIVLAAIKGRTPLMGACADVGHWKRSGLDPVECLKRLDGHVLALHFKDLVPDNPNDGFVMPDPKIEIKDKTPQSRKLHDVPWGTGTSNAKGMLEELKRQHFHGAICFEYEYHWTNSVPEIAESIKWFDATAAELGK